MSQSRLMTALLTAGLLMGTAGCQQYNGAAQVDGATPTVEARYRQFMLDQERQRQALAAQQAGLPALAPASGNDRSVRFETPATPAGTTPAAAAGQTQGQAAATIVPASNSRDPSMAQFGLYGQLPETSSQRRGPLDGPDNLRQISFASSGADMDPAVDPTGSWVVFASTRHRQTPDIYLQKIDGTAVQQLTNDAASDRMPAFSPDGRRIAFASNRAGNWDIFLTDPEGGQPIQLTSDPTQDIHPSFSPDGKRLVYCSYGSESGQWEMVVIDVDNPAKKRFIGFGLFPNWSPVEEKIVFQRPRQRGTTWFSIWTIEYADGEGVRPTEIAASSNAGTITPCWSPDGKHIVFCTVVNPGIDPNSAPRQADIWVMAADGSSRSNLTQNGFANVQPLWGRDGLIYFVSNRNKGSQENIWAMRPTAPLRVAQQGKTVKPGQPEEASAMAPTHDD